MSPHLELTWRSLRPFAGFAIRIFSLDRTMGRRSGFSGFLVLTSTFFVLAGSAVAADQPQWLRISSDHFIVLTDAGEKKGHEVAARFEQMRAMYGTLLSQHKLRMSEPLEIIAFKSDKDYAQLAPLRDGQPITAPAFFLAGEGRIYIVLNF